MVSYKTTKKNQLNIKKYTILNLSWTSLWSLILNLFVWATTCSLKINEIISSFQAGVWFFWTQLRLKIPVFELNNLFAFHLAWPADIQSILAFLHFIHDFTASVNIVRSPVCSIREKLRIFIYNPSNDKWTFINTSIFTCKKSLLFQYLFITVHPKVNFFFIFWKWPYIVLYFK